MAQSVCPWWLGYFLISPIRRWVAESPEAILSPHVKAGMTVLEPGPGMGFFTLALAQLAGDRGRVVAVDIQPKMIASLRRRAAKAGLIERIETRLARPDSLGIDDLKGMVDFVLAFAVVHEMPSTEGFFRESASALKPGGRLLLVEPAGHVSPKAFDEEIAVARRYGLEAEAQPIVRRSHAALMVKRTA